METGEYPDTFFGNPAVLVRRYELQTRGFASPPFGGFALLGKLSFMLLRLFKPYLGKLCQGLTVVLAQIHRVYSLKTGENVLNSPWVVLKS